MAKLVDVYRSNKPLSRRQLPLIIDENLTMVMDLNSMGLVCDNKLVKGKELEEFTRKMNLLDSGELRQALKVTRTDIVRVLNQAVPCVGCRRSVERLYYQLHKYGHPTLDPLLVTKEGIITIREDKQISQVLCTLFHGHSARLNNLVDSQPRRNKKSHRCLLHSLDSQRSRPITPVWRDVWECMKQDCKQEVVLIEASTLHSTLENYLRKHRFCGECRTKVVKAYSLLVEEKDPSKEKGYVSALYSGIKRCLPDKHIHLPNKTDYITKLISRAEPELLGSRRERHAKTLEIAQEEVLTCLGICVYERLHRIYMRMREEECTCQVFAAVAVDTLCRSFETAVEMKQGISQLELLYVELAKEEQVKQQRKEQKKLKRRRKKGNNRLTDEGKENNCNSCDDEKEADEEETETLKVVDDCRCMERASKNCWKDGKEDANSNNSSDNNCTSKGSTKKSSSSWLVEEDCKCSETDNQLAKTYNKVTTSLKQFGYLNSSNYPSSPTSPSQQTKTTHNGKSKDPGSGEHLHDCGYASENNNGCCETASGKSSIPSSPEGSELACSDSCCHHERENELLSSREDNDYFSHSTLFTNGNQLSLQEMLEDHSYSDDNSEECYISAEEVREFKTNNRQLCEQRKQLRETLQKRFAQLCVNGPLTIPRYVAHTNYASN